MKTIDLEFWVATKSKMQGSTEKDLFYKDGWPQKREVGGKNYQYLFPYITVKINCEISHM